MRNATSGASERFDGLGPRDRLPRQVVGLGVLSVAIGIALIVGAFWLLSGSSDSITIARAQSHLRDVGCTVQTKRATASHHVFRLNAKIDYNTSPPTNGPHYAIPALWGIYREPVSPLRLVHNLEHGGVSIQYGPNVSDTTLELVVEFYFKDRTAVVVAPLPTLGDRIALGAWVSEEDATGPGRRGEGHLALCRTFDESAFKAFRDAYRFKGPERLPPMSLVPGM